MLFTSNCFQLLSFYRPLESLPGPGVPLDYPLDLVLQEDWLVHGFDATVKRQTQLPRSDHSCLHLLLQRPHDRVSLQKGILVITNYASLFNCFFYFLLWNN